ncbi:Imm1 family immunity protein [Amycolatopsis sp. NPDC051102]|uniref:Imm1 family immunity protein n=1 Tax=Amycolatopsis sp. NPDC051102 TaxID=3155163 RepID=UPI003438937B
MVTLEVWYNQEPDNDYAEGDPPILVSTAAELDALIAQVQADTKGLPVPSMVECSVQGDPRRGVFDMGIGQDKGFVVFMTPRSTHTVGDASRTGNVIYDYMGNASEIPASYEVPMAEARGAAVAFLEREELPSSTEAAG